MKKNFLVGSTESHVHGKKRKITCHDMRKYVWQNYDFLQNIGKKDNKKKRP